MAKAVKVDFDLLNEKLQKRGSKLTVNRKTIIDTIIENEGQHLTVEEIYDAVKKKAPKIGVATVYRTVTLLEEVGFLSKLYLKDSCCRYEIVNSDETHMHHHLICNTCNEVIEVQDDLLEDLEESIYSKYGFEVLDHSVKFYGQCKKCREKMNKR